MESGESFGMDSTRGMDEGSDEESEDAVEGVGFREEEESVVMLV